MCSGFFIQHADKRPILSRRYLQRDLVTHVVPCFELRALLETLHDLAFRILERAEEAHVDATIRACKRASVQLDQKRYVGGSMIGSEETG